jgi:peptide-methionine (R)-S-oxide reductase
MDRRLFISRSLGAVGFLLTAPLVLPAFAVERIAKMDKTNAEWKKLLTAEQYNVLREEGTERAFTSPLNHEARAGLFVCVACGLPLFPSKFKFDSGTGWPSFYEAQAGSVETKTDFGLGTPRTEYHCARCGGHHGHVFNDGPRPTGLRYCNNGVVLRFVPDKSNS